MCWRFAEAVAYRRAEAHGVSLPLSADAHGPFGRSADARLWQVAAATATAIVDKCAGRVKNMVRNDRTESIQGRGARVEKAAAVGVGPRLDDEIRWLKPRTTRPRRAIADAHGNAPCSNAAEGRNLQA
jgi:hypothetical protein